MVFNTQVTIMAHWPLVSLIPNCVAIHFAGRLPHKHKIVIAGNHDLTFDDQMIAENPKEVEKFGLNLERVKTYLTSEGVSNTKDLLTNCVYLEDASIELCGIKIHGSPW